ncbi:hypothetical protein [Promicromonospora aerolata]|uniref:Uncharacterized protein n=1 Tax=Promicromonospora aerolata TaxID=195749 RepID=A0ABW4VBG4_9MICO
MQNQIKRVPHAESPSDMSAYPPQRARHARRSDNHHDDSEERAKQ